MRLRTYNGMTRREAINYTHNLHDREGVSMEERAAGAERVLESMPESVPVSELRAQWDKCGHEWRYNYCDHHSPSGYWVAEIGTDTQTHMCDWCPAHEHSEEFGAMRDVWDALREEIGNDGIKWVLFNGALGKVKCFDGFGLDGDWAFLFLHADVPSVLCRASLLWKHRQLSREST